MRIGLWNINSVGNLYNREKLDAVEEFLSHDQVSILALTEYINTEENNLDVVLQNDKKFPILSHPEVKRVGLAVPYFLKQHFSVEDQWFLSTPGRTTTRSDGTKVAMKSDKIAQILTLKYKNKSDKLYISVVYIAPDITNADRNIVFDKILGYNFQLKNYIALGDINFDQKIILNRYDLEDKFQGQMHQIVDQITRQKTVNRVDKSSGETVKSTSATTIDLIFLQTSLLSKYSRCKVKKNMPSDHNLVHCQIDFSVPNRFTTRKLRPDPLRRPKLRDDDIPKAKLMLHEELQNYSEKWANLTQSECFEIVEASIRKVLDEFCPLNPDKPKEVRVWRDRLSKEFRVAKNRRLARLNDLRKATAQLKRNPTSEFYQRKRMLKLEKFKYETKRYRTIIRKEKNIKNREESSEIKKDPNKIWKFVHSNDPIESNNDSSKMVIDGHEKEDMANHMNEFLFERAHLVDDMLISEFAEYIPLANFDYCEPKPVDEIIVNEIPVRELYFPKGCKPSLACGPDTISHKHIFDLFDVLEKPLQFAMDKPLDGFNNIFKNYTRLIKKNNISTKSDGKLGPKDVRPICEANILTKYGPIRAFINRLRKLILPFISQTQYSLPGKGCPTAIFDLLDDVNYCASLKKAMLLAIWDFSNAFCTFSHQAIEKILQSFKLSLRDLDLAIKVLDQTGTQVKMEDAEGHYVSQVLVTQRGGPQGQIGVDFLFIIANDNIQPVCDEETEIAKRKKYVDDWSDIFVANSIDLLIKLFEKNVSHTLNCANSIGLKLNDSKTQIIPVNCTGKLDSFSDELYDKRGLTRLLSSVELQKANENHELFKDTQKYKLIDRCEILNFSFYVMDRRLPNLHLVNVEDSVHKIISRLNSLNKYVVTSRKRFRSLRDRIATATYLIHSHIYDLGLVYPFVSETNFEKISTAMRNLIKNSGLDRFTSSNDIYRLSLGISPKNIALKQLVLIGLKKIDPISVQNNRYLIPRPKHGSNTPCLYKAITTFNSYSLDMRKKIIDNLVGQLNNRSADISVNYDAVKSIIKKHYSDTLFTVDNKLIAKGNQRTEYLNNLLSRCKYSRSRVRERIEKSIAASSRKTASSNTSSTPDHRSDTPDSVRFTLKHVKKK